MLRQIAGSELGQGHYNLAIVNSDWLLEYILKLHIGIAVIYAFGGLIEEVPGEDMPVPEVDLSLPRGSINSLYIELFSHMRTRQPLGIQRDDRSPSRK